MRISDWSSDVCSSDLMQPLSERVQAALAAFGQQHGLAIYLQPGGTSSVHPLWPENPRLAFRIASDDARFADVELERSEEHTSELQSLMRISYAVFCLKKKKKNKY